MRKYGLDEGAHYTEMNTLLEPNNFIPSWEAGDEEKKEVSVALRKLREKYDQIHKKVSEKKNANETLEKDIKKAKEEQKIVSRDFGGANEDSERSAKELQEVNVCHDEQRLLNATYHHMLDRMKKDLISLTLTINDLTESKRSKMNIQAEESRMMMNAKEQKLRAQYRLYGLMEVITHELKKRQERVTSLQLSISNKEQALQKRIQRVTRQQEIAELASNENRDQDEIEKKTRW